MVKNVYVEVVCPCCGAMTKPTPLQQGFKGPFEWFSFSMPDQKVMTIYFKDEEKYHA